MLLTKKKLYKIRNSKLQSRRKYRKKGGKKKRRRRKNKSFRRRKKPLNLRRKSLKYRFKKGGARNELFYIFPKSYGDNSRITSYVLAKVTKPDEFTSTEFINALQDNGGKAQGVITSFKHFTKLFESSGEGGGGSYKKNFKGIQTINRNISHIEFCQLRNQLLRAQLTGNLTRQQATEIIQPTQGPPTSTERPGGSKKHDDDELEDDPRPVLPTQPEVPEEEKKEDVPTPRPVLPAQPEDPGDSRNWCEKIQMTLAQIREDARAGTGFGRAWIENKTRQFLKSVNVNLVQIYGMQLLQEAGIRPTTPDFFNSLPIGKDEGDGDETQIGMTMNNCIKLQRFLKENPDRAPPGVVWPERPNPEDSPLVRPDPVQPSQDMIDAQQRERERIAAEKIQAFQRNRADNAGCKTNQECLPDRLCLKPAGSENDPNARGKCRPKEYARKILKNRKQTPTSGEKEGEESVDIGGLFGEEEPEEKYEEDFEDPCAGVKCDPGEKCVDGDCVEDDYSDESFERPDARDLPSIPGQTDGGEEADIICGSDQDCTDPVKPMCHNGTCVTRVEDFRPCQTDENCNDGQKCNDGGECVPLTPEEIQRRALNAQIRAGTELQSPDDVPVVSGEAEKKEEEEKKEDVPAQPEEKEDVPIPAPVLPVQPEEEEKKEDVPTPAPVLPAQPEEEYQFLLFKEYESPSGNVDDMIFHQYTARINPLSLVPGSTHVLTFTRDDEILTTIKIKVNMEERDNTLSFEQNAVAEGRPNSQGKVPHAGLKLVPLTQPQLGGRRILINQNGGRNQFIEPIITVVPDGVTRAPVEDFNPGITLAYGPFPVQDQERLFDVWKQTRRQVISQGRGRNRGQERRQSGDPQESDGASKHQTEDEEKEEKTVVAAPREREVIIIRGKVKEGGGRRRLTPVIRKVLVHPEGDKEFGSIKPDTLLTMGIRITNPPDSTGSGFVFGHNGRQFTRACQRLIELNNLLPQRQKLKFDPHIFTLHPDLLQNTGIKQVNIEAGKGLGRGGFYDVIIFAVPDATQLRDIDKQERADNLTKLTRKTLVMQERPEILMPEVPGSKLGEEGEGEEDVTPQDQNLGGDNQGGTATTGEGEGEEDVTPQDQNLGGDNQGGTATTGEGEGEGEVVTPPASNLGGDNQGGTATTGEGEQDVTPPESNLGRDNQGGDNQGGTTASSASNLGGNNNPQGPPGLGGLGAPEPVDNPIAYSMPSFLVKGQMYPGNYQPQIRFWAEDGSNFASWLRHLGEPNPLPTPPRRNNNQGGNVDPNTGGEEGPSPGNVERSSTSPPQSSSNQGGIPSADTTTQTTETSNLGEGGESTQQDEEEREVVRPSAPPLNQNMNPQNPYEPPEQKSAETVVPEPGSPRERRINRLAEIISLTPDLEKSQQEEIAKLVNNYDKTLKEMREQLTPIIHINNNQVEYTAIINTMLNSSYEQIVRNLSAYLVITIRYLNNYLNLLTNQDQTLALADVASMTTPEQVNQWINEKNQGILGFKNNIDNFIVQINRLIDQYNTIDRTPGDIPIEAQMRIQNQ